MTALKICPQCGTEYESDQRFCPKDGSTLRSQNPTGDLVGSIIADRYHVLRKLGEGGMGTVYLAEHVKMGRMSAVKVMNTGTVQNADAISRFNREASNASRINHPNVAAIYDFGETSEGMIYLAMEFVEGKPLTDVIQEAGTLPPRRAADITRQTAEALTVAHEMGIVHRDLKPDNIMITRTRDGGDLVKVVDFGIAKAADNDAQKVTRTGLVVGTPEYMSPEQLAGDSLDGRSDIYSLALVAFAMLTGKLPFTGASLQESMIARLTDEPRRLMEVRPEVNWPATVQMVMDKALSRDASQRYQTATDFGRELGEAIATMDSAAEGGATTVMRASAGVAGARTSGVTRPTPATAVHKPTRTGEVTGIEPRKRHSMIPMLSVTALIAAAGVYAAIWYTRSQNQDRFVIPVAGSTSAADTVTAPTLMQLTLLLDDLARDARDSSRALLVLDSMPKLRQYASDTLSEVRIHYITAVAHGTLGRDSLMCRALNPVEGKARQINYVPAVPLLDACAPRTDR